MNLDMDLDLDFGVIDGYTDVLFGSFVDTYLQYTYTFTICDNRHCHIGYDTS